MGTDTLVLGATSLVGRFAAAYLPEATGAGRGARPEGYARWVTLDLADPHLTPPAAHTVVSLSPLWLLPSALPALAGAGMRRLVALSSTSRWTKADSPEPAERDTARSLADAEDALTAACAALDVRWTVLRPTLIYAEGLDRNVSRLAELARRFGFLPLAGRGEGLRQPVHAADIAAALPRVLAAPATHDRAYDLPGGETLSYAEMCRRVFEGLGRRPRLVHAPAALWRTGLALARPWLPGATGTMGDRMDVDLAFDPAPAARDFGWAPRPFRPEFRQGRSVQPS